DHRHPEVARRATETHRTMLPVPAPSIVPALVEDRHIDVNALEVRRALARSFTGIDPAGHAWRGHIVIGGPVVTVDVGPHGTDPPYVHAWADILEAPEGDGLVARTLAVE